MSGLSQTTNEFSAMLDATYPATLDREAHTWRRLMKIGEEFGEVIEARLGTLAENPRKGRSHTPDDVYRELLDVAFCALAACAHMDGNEGDVLADLTAHARATYKRLSAALTAPRPDVESPREDRRGQA